MGRPAKKISQFDVKLGSVVAARRLKRGKMTQQELSDMSGVPLSNLQRREDGKNEFTVSEMERIAKALSTTPLSLVKEALDDYGGIDKLIAEYVAVSDAPDTVDELAKKREEKDLGSDFDEDDYASAANHDVEHDQDEPEQP